MKRLMHLASELRALPQVTINLHCADADRNDVYYAGIARDFYRNAVRRHPKFPFVHNLEYGFSLHVFGPERNGYARSIESSARRNCKKAERLGYRFERIDLNAHIDDVTAILRSTPVRQGRQMPEVFFAESAERSSDPPSHADGHDYPYFGILRDGHLYAYASCLVAGELCSIERIYGHAEHLADGVVPLLVVEMANWIAAHYSAVRYYAYGTYYGGTETMQRFKWKFDFKPHHVHWVLGA